MTRACGDEEFGTEGEMQFVERGEILDEKLHLGNRERIGAPPISWCVIRVFVDLEPEADFFPAVLVLGEQINDPFRLGVRVLSFQA